MGIAAPVSRLCEIQEQPMQAGWHGLPTPARKTMPHGLPPARYLRDGLDTNAPPPFATLPTQAPLAAALAQLIVTHHRLPSYPTYNGDGSQSWLGKRRTSFKTRELPSLLASVTHAWNEISTPANASTIAAYWQFARPASSAHLPTQMERTSQQTGNTAIATTATTSIIISTTTKAHGCTTYVMHISRLILMLADHHYSSLPLTQ